VASAASTICAAEVASGEAFAIELEAPTLGAGTDQSVAVFFMFQFDMVHLFFK